MKKILQLSSDFQYQKLYPNLVRGLSQQDIGQIVFLQTRGNEPYVELDDIKNVSIVQTFQHRLWMKFLFKKRITALKSSIQNSVNLAEVSLTVAYFLFTDGAVANELYKQNGTPFIVAIRNSDVNHYFKYRFWLKGYIKEVMTNASKIIFPSPSYIKATKDIVGDAFYSKIIHNKIEIVGNIIDDAWFDGVTAKEPPNSEINIIYAGEFSKNKRLDAVISSFRLFTKKNTARLFLVGNYGDYVDKIVKLAEPYENIHIIDKVDCVRNLISIFDKCHILVMPSKTETFGNAYIEAMARGLPIVYSKGQGVDGYFEDGEVGFPVSPPLDRSILESLENILKDYSNLSRNAIEGSMSFTKGAIVKKYIDIFNKVKK